MGSCGISKRHVVVESPQIVKAIAIESSKFVARSNDRFSDFYSIGESNFTIS
jgi:hypothetical protein